MKNIIAFNLCMLLVSVTQAQQKVIRLEGIKIQADNEAPQVMYVIPWQSPEGAERLYSPISSGKVERLRPIDPYTFELELGLHEQWKNTSQAGIDLVP